MEKLEELKTLEETKLQAMKQEHTTLDTPTGLGDYQILLGMLKSFTDDPALQIYRTKLIEKLIHRVEITPTSFKLYFHVGSSHIERELATTAGSRLFLCPKGAKGVKRAHEGPAGFTPAAKSGDKNYFELFGSNSLQNGWPGRTRTYDSRINSVFWS